MNSEQETSSVDLFDALAQLWAGRWWILLSVLIVTAAASALAFTITPVYRASTVLIPAGQERAGLGGMLASALGSLGGLASLAGVNVGATASGTEEALAVLRSREFIEKFITDKQLMRLLFADQWDASANRWKVPPEKQPTLALGVKYFVKKILNVTQDKKTGLITLQIEWRDRIAAADWANDLVRRINAAMRTRSIANADASLGYLRKELDATSVVETRVAISRLVEAQINQRMISSVSDEFSFRVVERAVAPDRGDTARPNKPIMIMFGLFTGFALGSSIVIFSALLRRSDRRPR